MYISAMTAFQKSAFRFLQSKAKRKTHIKLSVPILFLGCWTLCELSDTWWKGHLRRIKADGLSRSAYIFSIEHCNSPPESICSFAEHLASLQFQNIWKNLYLFHCSVFVHFLVYKRLFSFLHYFLVFLFLFGMFMMLEQYFKLLGVTSVIKSNLKSLYAELTTMPLNLH